MCVLVMPKARQFSRHSADWVVKTVIRSELFLKREHIQIHDLNLIRGETIASIAVHMDLFGIAKQENERIFLTAYCVQLTREMFNLE